MPTLHDFKHDWLMARTVEEVVRAARAYEHYLKNVFAVEQEAGAKVWQERGMDDSYDAEYCANQADLCTRTAERVREVAVQYATWAATVEMKYARNDPACKPRNEVKL
jgi:hypothetical protein